MPPSSTESTTTSSTTQLIQGQIVLPLLATLGVLLVVRDVWRAIPTWAKDDFFRKFRRRASSSFREESKHDSDSNMNDDVNEDNETEEVDSNDLTNLYVISSKLLALLKAVQDKIAETAKIKEEEEEQEEETGKTTTDNNQHDESPSKEVAEIVQEQGQSLSIYPFVALIQMLSQAKEHGQLSDAVNMISDSGKPASASEVQDLDRYFDLADWAYIESRHELQQKLDSFLFHKDVVEKEDSNQESPKEATEGFSLLRHDTTALPGYVGHYVAIHAKLKLAIIGIKGTSNFEDFLTDMCGMSVTAELEAPFCTTKDHVRSSSVIHCHEGCWITAQRLVRDIQPMIQELFLPAGYRIVLVGHSLGAAVAALSAILLRSKIPQLTADDDKGETPPRLRVLAYACPPVVDYATSRACASFCTTIVNKSDVLPRSSLYNLTIALRGLQRIQCRLIELGMDGSTAMSTYEFWNWFSQGKDGNMLIEIEELKACLNGDGALEDKKQKQEDRRVDPDHMFVPGKVIAMYKTPKEANSEPNSEESKEGSAPASTTAFPPHDYVVWPDGAMSSLMAIEWNEQMVSDHLCDGYRDALKSVPYY